MTDKYYNSVLVDKIRKELVDVSYYEDVKYNIESKSRWKFLGDVSEGIAQLLMGVSSILAFAAGAFNYTVLSFIAGAIGVGSLVLLRISAYAMKESSERTAQVNRVLDQIGINKIPDIVINSADVTDV